MEWLITLHAQKLVNIWDLPEASALDELTAPWLETWSTYMDGLAGEDFKAERRAVIEESFAKLRGLCEAAATSARVKKPRAL